MLIAAIGVFAIGWIVSSYARKIHAAGSLYDYVTQGLGARVGTAAGWLYYAGVTVLVTGLLVLIGGYLQSTIQSEFNVNPLPAGGTPHYFAIFSWGSTFGGFALVVVYLMMALGSARSFGPTPGFKPAGWVAAVIAVAITGGAIFGSFYKVTSPTIEAPWYALGVLVVGYLSTFVFRPRASASTQLSDLTKSAV